jgi:hypothetical protein
LLENRGSHGAAAINNHIYAIGGGGLHSNLSTCEKFSVETQSWSMIATMTTFRHALTIATHQGDIYAVGGWFNGSKCSGETEKYSVANDNWVKLASMNVPRRLLGATTLKDRIYTFGGNVDDGVWYSDVVEVYDILKDCWTLATPLPCAGPTSCVTINDEDIYVFLHGKGIYKFIPDLETPSSSTYEWIASLPIAEWFCFNVCSLSTVVFLNGGVANGKFLDCMYAFDVRSVTWKEMPPMLRQRRRCASAVVVA